MPTETRTAAPADTTAESFSAPLVRALLKQQSAYRDAIDKLREMASPESASDVFELTSLLRESVELAGVLRRAVASLSREQIYRAFGVPGDFGYDTQLGAALAQVYSAKDGAS